MPNKYADETVVQQVSGVTATDLGLSSGDFTTLLSNLNERASERIERWCGRDFIQHTGDVVKRDGYGARTLLLPGSPIISVATVKVGTTTLAAADYRVKPSDSGIPGENSGVLERKNTPWPAGWNNVEVTYTWGYATTPLPVKDAAEALMGLALQAAVRDKRRKGVTSMTMDGFGVTFSEALQLLPPELQVALMPFRRLPGA